MVDSHTVRLIVIVERKFAELKEESEATEENQDTECDFAIRGSFINGKVKVKTRQSFVLGQRALFINSFGFVPFRCSSEP